VDELQRRFEAGASEGYRVVGVRDRGAWKAAAGFHIFTNFNNGRILYVDDLVTIQESRSKGYGKFLNDHLVQLARNAGCASIELDSGVHRHDAHRFYLRERYDISSHHFSRRLEGER
jgi:GNAT superfamily N-acetyltransferase